MELSTRDRHGHEGGHGDAPIAPATQRQPPDPDPDPSVAPFTDPAAAPSPPSAPLTGLGRQNREAKSAAAMRLEWPNKSTAKAATYWKYNVSAYRTDTCARGGAIPFLHALVENGTDQPTEVDLPEEKQTFLALAATDRFRPPHLQLGELQSEREARYLQFGASAIAPEEAARNHRPNQPNCREFAGDEGDCRRGPADDALRQVSSVAEYEALSRSPAPCRPFIAIEAGKSAWSQHQPRGLPSSDLRQWQRNLPPKQNRDRPSSYSAPSSSAGAGVAPSADGQPGPPDRDRDSPPAAVDPRQLRDCDLSATTVKKLNRRIEAEEKRQAKEEAKRRAKEEKAKLPKSERRKLSEEEALAAKKAKAKSIADRLTAPVPGPLTADKMKVNVAYCARNCQPKFDPVNGAKADDALNKANELNNLLVGFHRSLEPAAIASLAEKKTELMDVLRTRFTNAGTAAKADLAFFVQSYILCYRYFEWRFTGSSAESFLSSNNLLEVRRELQSVRTAVEDQQPALIAELERRWQALVSAGIIEAPRPSTLDEFIQLVAAKRFDPAKIKEFYSGKEMADTQREIDDLQKASDVAVDHRELKALIDRLEAVERRRRELVDQFHSKLGNRLDVVPDEWFTVLMKYGTESVRVSIVPTRFFTEIEIGRDPWTIAIAVAQGPSEAKGKSLIDRFANAQSSEIRYMTLPAEVRSKISDTLATHWVNATKQEKKKKAAADAKRKKEEKELEEEERRTNGDAARGQHRSRARETDEKISIKKAPQHEGDSDGDDDDDELEEPAEAEATFEFRLKPVAGASRIFVSKEWIRIHAEPVSGGKRQRQRAQITIRFPQSKMATGSGSRSSSTDVPLSLTFTLPMKFLLPNERLGLDSTKFECDTFLRRDRSGRYWIDRLYTAVVGTLAPAPDADGRALIVAIDPGSVVFASCFDSNGRSFDLGLKETRPLEQLQGQIEGIQREMDRIKEERAEALADWKVQKRSRYQGRNPRLDPSNPIDAQLQEVITRVDRRLTGLGRAKNRLHSKVTNRTHTLQERIATELCTRGRVILLPELRTSNMAKRRRGRRLNKKAVRELLTLSHFKFRQILAHKAALYGVKLIFVNESYTSKTCGSCGRLKRNLSGSRVFHCSECKAVLNRDTNGARNILFRWLIEHRKNDLWRGCLKAPFGPDQWGQIERIVAAFRAVDADRARAAESSTGQTAERPEEIQTTRILFEHALTIHQIERALAKGEEPEPESSSAAPSPPPAAASASPSTGPGGRDTGRSVAAEQKKRRRSKKASETATANKKAATNEATANKPTTSPEKRAQREEARKRRKEARARKANSESDQLRPVQKAALSAKKARQFKLDQFLRAHGIPSNRRAQTPEQRRLVQAALKQIAAEYDALYKKRRRDAPPSGKQLETRLRGQLKRKAVHLPKRVAKIRAKIEQSMQRMRRIGLELEPLLRLLSRPQWQLHWANLDNRASELEFDRVHESIKLRELESRLMLLVSRLPDDDRDRHADAIVGRVVHAVLDDPIPMGIDLDDVSQPSTAADDSFVPLCLLPLPCPMDERE